MKKYERALQRLSTLGTIVMGLAIIFVVIYLFSRVIKSGEDQSEAQSANIAWCLTNGGRRVAIDGRFDCFKLTMVADSLIARGFLGEPRSTKCKRRADAVWIKVRGGDKNCFHFERLVREVK